MTTRTARQRRAVRQVSCGLVSLACDAAVLVFFFSAYYLQDEIRLGHAAQDAIYVAACLYIAAAVAGVTSVGALVVGSAD